MHRIPLFTRLAFAFILLLPLTVRAADAVDDRPPPALAKVQEYLQSIKTVQARFVQTAPDGRQSAGTFYLSRPGRLRFEYDAPVRDFVVADGIFIYFYDGQLNQQSNAPIGQTLADFLLRKNLKLSGDVTVTDMRRTPEGLLLVSLVQTADPSTGTLTLCFTEDPELQLKKWRVVDGTGAITEVELTDFQAGMKLSYSLFVYKKPDETGGHYNQ